MPFTVPLEIGAVDDGAVLEGDDNVFRPGSVIAEVFGGFNPVLFSGLFVYDPFRVVGIVAIRILDNADGIHDDGFDGVFYDFDGVGEVIAGDRGVDLIGVADRPLVVVVLLGCGDVQRIPSTVPFEAVSFNNGAVLEGDDHIVPVRIGGVVAEILGSVNAVLFSGLFVYDPFRVVGIVAIRILDNADGIHDDGFDGAFDERHVIGEVVAEQRGFDLTGGVRQPLVFIALLYTVNTDAIPHVIKVEAVVVDDSAILQCNDHIVPARIGGVIVEILGCLDPFVGFIVIVPIGCIIAV